MKQPSTLPTLRYRTRVIFTFTLVLALLLPSLAVAQSDPNGDGQRIFLPLVVGGPAVDQVVQAAASSDIVISQVYGGGGNSGATYTNDFIELFNLGSAAVDITGWSVQYASSAGSSWSKTILAGTIAPGQYYLIQEATGAGGTTPLPTPDATGTIALSATNGKVVLVNNSTTVTGTCPTESSVVDIVGFGSANCFETSATPPLTNSTATSRIDSCMDTDNNSVDFTNGAPTPRNSATPITSCAVGDLAPAVSSTTPTEGATDFPIGGNLSVTFSEPVDTAPGAFALNCSVSGVVSLAISGGASTFTLDPTTDLANGESCTLTVAASAISDQDTNDPPDTMAADVIVNFTPFNVCEASFTPIYSIQGSGLSAAITGNVTTQGVVVGDFEGSSSQSGFYIQDATGDGDAATSDGIFVFTGNSNLVSVGQVVRVTGFARERFNQTAINGTNSNSSAVPVANVVACGTGSVPATDVTMPFASGDTPEQYEGMYVRFPQPLVISEYFNYDRFGELVLALPLDGEDRPFTGTAVDAPGTAANARTLANSLRRITLDDANSSQNPVVLRHPNGEPFSLTNRFRGGDTVQNAVGVLGYDFNLYRIIPTAAADYTAVNLRPEAPEAVGGTLRVAAMNTLNFFVTADYPTNDPLDNKCGPAQNFECRGWDSDQVDEFTRQRTKLLTALSGLDADVIGLNELENTTGVEPLASIVDGLPGYDYIDTGVIGTDAIKVGLIYRPANVTPVGTYKTLDSTVDPRFIDTKNRPSLAQTFAVNATGARFTVVVNHLKSKGSACDDVGDVDAGDGQGNCNATRTYAAEALVDWIASDPTGSADIDYIIMGDLNSYAMEDPISAIKAGSDGIVGTNDDFTNLISNFNGPYAYSYVFDGQFGYLDHALSNGNLLAQITGAEDWHINADEPDILDYDTSFKPPAQDALYEPNQYRTSDHDPVLVGMDLLHYNFSGFFAPIDNPSAVNTRTAGSTVPIKFSLNGNLGLDILANGSPASQQIDCVSLAPIGAVEPITNGALVYDPLSDQYQYNWKTSKSWNGTCRRLIVTLDDGSQHFAYFAFSKNGKSDEGELPGTSVFLPFVSR